MGEKKQTLVRTNTDGNLDESCLDSNKLIHGTSWHSCRRIADVGIMKIDKGEHLREEWNQSICRLGIFELFSLIL